MLDSKYTQQQMVVNKFASPSTDYEMTVRDYIVQAFASAPITITLPTVATAIGRMYSISAGLASATNTITVTNKSDSNSWLDIILTSTGSHILFYSDGLKWHNISNMITLTGNITGTEDESGVIDTIITDKAVTYAKIQDVGIDSILGQTGTAGTVIEIPCTAAGRLFISGADTVEQLAILGITASATELNQTIGVSSNIQTQLDNKEASNATLTSLALLGTAADKYVYTTSIDTWVEGDITTAGRALLDDADNIAQLVTLGLTATASEINNVADVSARTQSLTVSGAITAGTQSVELDNITTVVAATIADASTHQGLFIVKNTSASGTLAHTLTLTIGTFDGTATIVTLNAPNDAVTVYFDSVVNGTVLALTGTAALT